MNNELYYGHAFSDVHSRMSWVHAGDGSYFPLVIASQEFGIGWVIRCTLRKLGLLG